LLEELQASHLVTLQRRLEITVIAPPGRRAVLRSSPLPAPLHLGASMARYPFLSVGDRAAVVRAMLRLRGVDPNDPAADSRSFGDWLREQRQSPEAVEAIWSLIARPTLNLHVDSASLAQAAQVFQLGLLSQRSAGDVGFARVPLGKIHDEAARRALSAAGVDVRLRCAATCVAPTDTRFRVDTSGTPTVQSDAVILAVPPERAARLLPAGAGLDQRTASSLGSSPIVNLHVVYDRHVLDVPFAAGVYSPVQWIFDRTAGAGLSSGQYLAVSLSAAEEDLHAPADELRTKYLEALADILPAARGASVARFFVTRDHAATFRAAPGARAWRPGARTQVPGLILAGAWTDTGWPATMEGAVRSGQAAALEAIDHVQHAAPPGAEIARPLAGAPA
jgi:squalene-associated FAD-dependent desaturase